MWLYYRRAKNLVLLFFVSFCTLLRRPSCLSHTLMPTVHSHSFSYSVLLPCLCIWYQPELHSPFVFCSFALHWCHIHAKISESLISFSLWGNFFLVCHSLHNDLSEFLNVISCKENFIIIFFSPLNNHRSLDFLHLFCFVFVCLSLLNFQQIFMLSFLCLLKYLLNGSALFVFSLWMWVCSLAVPVSVSL